MLLLIKTDDHVSVGLFLDFLFIFDLLVSSNTSTTEFDNLGLLYFFSAVFYYSFQDPSLAFLLFNFVCKYYILLDVTVNGTVLLSLIFRWLLVYRNGIALI